MKYFNCIELVGKIEVSGAAALLARISAEDSQTNVRYVSQRPPLLSAIPVIPMPAPGVNPILPAQYPDPRGVFPWTEALIPWKKNQPFPNPADPGLIILPPAPVPINPVPPPVNGPIYLNGYNDQYDKFKSVPNSILFYLGYDPDTVSPTQKDWTLFLRNFVDRGSSGVTGTPLWQVTNFAKRQYMNAFAVDKMQFYLDKIHEFVMTSYSEVTVNRLPLVSSFEKNVVLFFLKLHIGVHQFPQYVIDYFTNFIRFVGIGDPNNAERNNLLMEGYLNASRVFDYFKEKATEAIGNNDTSTIAYWWNLSGLPLEALLFESVHNIVAFSQFNNVLYSVIYTTIVPTNVILPSAPYPNFLNLYQAAPTSNEKLNVVREAYRILVPNSNSFSKVNPQDGVSLQARHLHQQIMITSSGGLTGYFTYNTAQYAGFSTNFDGITGLAVSNNFEVNFPTSPLDQETVVDASRPMIPIFPRPTYAPFGLGYRRCAGEIFVYLVTLLLFDQFKQSTYYISTDPNKQNIVYIAPFKGVPDNIYAVQVVST